MRVTPFLPWAVDFLWEDKGLLRIKGQRLKKAGRPDLTTVRGLAWPG